MPNPFTYKFCLLHGLRNSSFRYRQRHESLHRVSYPFLEPGAVPREMEIHCRGCGVQISTEVKPYGGGGQVRTGRGGAGAATDGGIKGIEPQWHQGRSRDYET